MNEPPKVLLGILVRSVYDRKKSVVAIAVEVIKPLINRVKGSKHYGNQSNGSLVTLQYFD